MKKSYLWLEWAVYAKLAAPAIAVGLVLSRVSTPIAFVAASVTAVAILYCSQRFWQPRLHGEQRELDDRHVFHGCRSGSLSRFRAINRYVPSDPRCRVCLIPFAGAGRVMGARPTGKNPYLFGVCFEGAPLGGYEEEVGVLFADLRGFTTWSETHDPAAAAALLSQFYAVAHRTLTRDDALVEFVGDQIMALYLVVFPSMGERTSDVMVAAARRLLDACAAEGLALPVGVGVHRGLASVGNVGKGDIKDFTAVGDVVNTGARLQAVAKAGEIVVSEDAFDALQTELPGARARELELKGKRETVRVRIL